MNLDYKDDGRLDMLKKRAKRCVCKYCGQPLSLKKITFSDIDDARVEIFCKSCDRIEFGVEPEIYQSALYFVEEMGFNYYQELDKNEKTKRMNVAKACEIMAWENKNLGILNKNGFTVPLEVNSNIIGECVVLEDKDIDEMEHLVLGKLKCRLND